MPKMMQDLIEQYVEAVKKIYGSRIERVFARSVLFLYRMIY